MRLILKVCFVCWLLVVIFSWFFSHFYGDTPFVEQLVGLYQFWGGDEFFSVFASFFSGAIFLVLIQVWLSLRGVKQLLFHVHFLYFIAWFVFIAWYVFSSAAFLRILPGENTSLFLWAEFSSVNVSFFRHLLASLAWLVGLFSVLFLFGSVLAKLLFDRIFSRHQTDDFSGCEVFFRLAIGLIGLCTVLFFLAWYGVFNREVLGLFLGVLLVVSRKHTFEIVRFFRRKISIRVPTHSLWPLIIWAVFLVGVSSFLWTIRPIPVRFDDTSYYLYRAQSLAESGIIVGGGYHFPIELLFSVGYLFGHGAQFALATVFGGLVLTTGALYFFSRYFFGKRSALLGVLIWLSIPMVWYLSSFEAKPDFFLVFVQICAIGMFFQWIRKNEKSFLYGAALLFGFSLVIKLTALFVFWATILIAGVRRFILGGKLNFDRKQLRTYFCMLLFFFAPLFPWAAYGFFTFSGTAYPHSYSPLLSSRDQNSLAITSSQWNFLGVDSKKCVYTGANEDFGRYMESRLRPAWQTYIFIPWSVTMNTSLQLFGTEIGYLFLAFAPGMFFLLRKRFLNEERGGERVLLIGILTVGILSWLLLGRSVPWYGMPLLALFSIFCGVLISSVKSYFLKIMLYGSFVISIFMNMIFSYSNFNTDLSIAYLGGMVSKDDFIRSVHPNSQRILSVVNRDIDAKIYQTNGQFSYYIDQSRGRVLTDSLLDTFSCLDQGRNDEETMRRIRQLGFRYFIYNRNLIAGNKVFGADAETLQSKVGRFEDFAKHNFVIVEVNRDLILFQVPGS